MDTASLLGLIGSISSAVATVALTFLTAKYVRLTNSLVEEAKAAKLPSVYVDLELDEIGVKLLIGNSGSSPAKNIKFFVNDTAPWKTHRTHQGGLNALSPIKDGISYLAPGRILKYQAGYIENDAEFFAAGSTIDFDISFESETGLKQRRQFTVALHSYAEVLYESFRHPEREVARAIRDAESTRKTDSSIKGMFSNFGKKACPSCRQYISPKARKCPKCLHIISKFRRS